MRQQCARSRPGPCVTPYSLPEVHGLVLYILQRLSEYTSVKKQERGEEPSLAHAAVAAWAELGCGSVAVSCPKAYNILVSHCLSLIPLSLILLLLMYSLLPVAIVCPAPLVKARGHSCFGSPLFPHQFSRVGQHKHGSDGKGKPCY